MSKETKNELRLLSMRLENELRDPVPTEKVASTIGAMWQIIQEELELLNQLTFDVVKP